MGVEIGDDPPPNLTSIRSRAKMLHHLPGGQNLTLPPFYISVPMTSPLPRSLILGVVLARTPRWCNILSPHKGAIFQAQGINQYQNSGEGGPSSKTIRLKKGGNVVQHSGPPQ